MKISLLCLRDGKTTDFSKMNIVLVRVCKTEWHLES
jgi:hypothetical protein